MGEIIFCKTRFQGSWNEQTQAFEGGYASYHDFWQMVKWAGYKSIWVDELDPQSDNTYIITPLNDEWLSGWPKHHTAEIIHWEFEWRWDERKSWQEPPGVNRVWHIDKWFAEKYGFEYVPMGGDERLNEVGQNYPADKLYDVAVMSYQTYRRQQITAQLENAGLRLAPISGLWGRRRSDALVRSHVMVHTHQIAEAPGVACLRWAIAAAHRLPLITETVKDRGIFTKSYMPMADYQYLAQFARDQLKDFRTLNNYGLALHSLLCRDYTFKRAVDSHV